MSVYKIRYGTPEEIVPSKFAPAPKCEVLTKTPEEAKSICFNVTKRGSELFIPIDPQEQIYGFGLQLKSFRQRGLKKTIRPNADPRSDSGDTHAPVPFFVTTAGFGVFLDTARYASFYCGRSLRPKSADEIDNENAAQELDVSNTDENSIFDTLYAARKGGKNNVIAVEIPDVEGVDLYYITGDNILSIVSQYNMLSGGGCMPPMWGLGCFYRCDMKFNENEVLDMARQIREKNIPCDVLGLEPGWQSRAYSSSFVWHPENFSHAEETVKKLTDEHFHVNIWEQAFIHPTSPLYRDMIENSGDYLVWNGLVPDFALESTRKVFGDYQKKLLVDLGVSGFKLDECDGSDFTGGWTFPNCATFPCGADGEQYHNLFGTLFAQTMTSTLGEDRTYGEVRNLGSLAASYPYVLYSDLYDHKDFITGVVNSGFSGILWTPEVRHATDKEDLLRRLQATVFSAQALTNAFYLSSMPWDMHDCTDEARELLRTRMSLIPYLFTAFYDYHTTGKPPVRALVCDFADEPEALKCADEYLFGDAMLVAPILSGQTERDVWLPRGTWYDFFTGEKYEGGVHHMAVPYIPVFVKSGTLLPIAEPVDYVDRDTCFALTLRAYGKDAEDAVCRLAEDSDDTHSASYTVHELTVGTAGKISDRYRVVGIERIQ
jgi:alpha-D-xyloside xylohydrolase